MDLEIGSAISEGLVSPPAPPAPVPDTSAAPATPAPASADQANAPVAVPAVPAAASPSVPAVPDMGKPDALPMATALDWRDRMKKAETELAALKAAQAPTVPPVPVPSFKDDPDGFAAYMADATNRVATSTRFDTSEMYSREKHGDALVSEAMDWGMQRAQQSPAFAAEYLQQKNPIDWAVKQMKRAKLADEIGDDEEKFFAARAEKLGYVKTAPVSAAPAAPATPQVQATAPAVPQPASQAAPTRSLASAPSAGGPQIVPTGDFAAFDALPLGR